MPDAGSTFLIYASVKADFDDAAAGLIAPELIFIPAISSATADC
jgi:hypothetical protein